MWLSPRATSSIIFLVIDVRYAANLPITKGNRQTLDSPSHDLDLSLGRRPGCLSNEVMPGKPMTSVGQQLTNS
jgi:hypothetical protein